MALVTISIRDILGEGFACPIVFTPIETPIISGSSLIVTRETQVTTEASGEGQITLTRGKYKVTFPLVNSDVITIDVPDDLESHALTELIEGGDESESE